MNKNIAILGATGLVGRTMLKVLEERNFPINNLKLLASAKSVGTKINFKNSELVVEEVSENAFNGIDIALFSAGKTVSKKWAPIAAEKGCVVIDNSSAWRMDPNIPLVVPEVNSQKVKGYRGIIANPNCSTIQMVVVLNEIFKHYGLKRVIVSTYQSISGAGQKGVDKLLSEIDWKDNLSASQIAYNTLFHEISDEFGFTEEEIKMINETHKIMELPNLAISVTCVRLPILGGHAESIIIQTEKRTSVEELKEVLSRNKSIIVLDEPLKQVYATPYHSKNRDEIFVSRIREDKTFDNGFYLWVVADNLRKGAATNAVQIAELYLD